MTHQGSCLCGAVTFKINKRIEHAGACHCINCRRWSGGIYVSVEVGPDEIIVEGAENIGVFKSSEWAQRAFCKTCGSSLWYEATAPGPFQYMKYLAMGTLANPDGIPLTEELFIDQKPDGYAFVQETRQLTKADFEAMFSAP